MFDPDRALSAGKLAALKLLKEALDDAEDVGSDRWQFAVRKEALLAAGVSVSDLRWLIVSHLAEANNEITRHGHAQRTFRQTPSLALLDGDCFVLTHLGVVYIRNHLISANGASLRDRSVIAPRRAPLPRDQHSQRSRRAPDSCGGAPPWDRPRPQWRSTAGELYFRDQLARRRGRKIAILEEFLLGRFAEANWEQSLLLALPAGPIETLGQLKECVRRLNDHMLLDALRFHACAGVNGPIASWEDRELA